MSWFAIERFGRILWSAFLASVLLGSALEILGVSGLIDDGMPKSIPLWQLHHFPNIQDFYESQGVGAIHLCFALAGLWIPQQRRWLNWAWSTPFVASTILHNYIYP